ncbi:MAG: hypothetical protein P9X24_02100 [Candidatus Hatepunaea meridiana]|nr:hypothetical protein [Candidatus Hatepunaea meridiana]
MKTCFTDITPECSSLLEPDLGLIYGILAQASLSTPEKGDAIFHQELF